MFKLLIFPKKLLVIPRQTGSKLPVECWPLFWTFGATSCLQADETD
jgi:hypothetical protein